MIKFRTLLKEHALIAGGIVVTILLLIIFFLQYRALKTLGETLPAYRKQVLGQYLKTVIEEVVEFYYDQAERALSVPSKSIEVQDCGVIQDNKDRTASLKAVAQVADHFKQQNFRGAKRYFIAIATEHAGEERNEVFFYDPVRQTMVADPKAPELVAINVACAPFMVYIRAGTAIMASAQGIDRDAQNRLIVKPVQIEMKRPGESKKNEEMRKTTVAVAGMILDQNFLFDTLLPEAIRKSSSKLPPAEEKNAIMALRYMGRVIGLYDGQGNKLLQWTKASEKEDEKTAEKEAKIEPESIQPFNFVLTNVRLSIRLKDLTVGQWARRNFVINLSLWTLMAVLLLAAIALMLRTASREMKLTQMKADFVSNVSHELRTPLASIRVLAELLNLGRVKDSSKVREYGGYIESEGRRLTQLINNILDFSRIESGRKAYNFEQANIKELVDGTLEAFSLQLTRNGFAIDYQALKKSYPDVIIDPDAIALALNNLIDNAIKYSKEEKKIFIRLDHQENRINIAITDQGIGIPCEEQEKIFEKFYRVSTGLVHDVKGSGLGLSLVKHIVEAHDGEITVKSEPGKGSTFTIHLPVTDSTAKKIDRAGPERIDDQEFSIKAKA